MVILSLLVPSLLLASRADAQLSRVFSWGFSGDTTATSLSACESVTIGINQETETITPPYYGFNIPVNGTPSIQTLGTGNTGSYRINYAADTQLILGFVDAFGRFGGWSNTYDVQAGSTGCLASVPSAGLTLTLNTTSVNTCDVVGVTISGGTPPYTATIVPVNSVTSSFNITLPSTDNYLSYVNDLQPSSNFVFAVRDSRGRWAPTSNQVSTFGQAANCVFASTSSRGPPTSSVSARPVTTTQQSTTTSTTAPSSGGSNTGAIAGGVVGGLAALALLGLLAFCFLRRRKRARTVYAAPRDATYHGPPSPTLDAADYSDNEPVAPVTPFALASVAGSEPRASTEDSRSRTHTHNPSNMSESNLSHFHISNPDSQPPLAPFMVNNRNSSGSSLSGRGGLPLPPGASGSNELQMEEMGANTPKGVLAGSSVSSNRRDVLQHEDAGEVLPDEIPPAYAGIRSSQNQQ